MVQNLSQQVIASCSNQVWCLSFSSLGILVEDESGTMPDHPMLAVLCDVYSSVVSGYHLGLGKPNLQMAVAALRHAILRKNYPLGDRFLEDWAVYGVPKILMVDAFILWTSGNFAPLHHLLKRLGISLVQRTALSAGTTIERLLKGFSSRVESLPLQSTGRSAAVEGQALLTLAQLDRLLVRYIADEYNQSLHPGARNQMRLERWQAGLTSNPPVLSEQDFEV
jgi:putative transposase